MMTSRDGYKGCVVVEPQAVQSHRGSVPRHMAVLFAACLASFVGYGIADVHGDSGVMPVRVAPMVGVLVNRATGGEGESLTPAQGGVVAMANRPMSLAVLAEREKAETAAPGIMGPEFVADDGKRGLDASVNEQVVLGDVTQAEPKAPGRPEGVVKGDQPASQERDRTPGDSIVSSIRLGGSEAQPISIAKNTIAVIDLKTEFNRAEIADPKIAEIIVESPRRVVVAGKEIGNTQLVLWIGEKQRVFDIAVELNLTALQGMIKSRAPTSDVQVSSVNGKIVLTGYVADPETASQIADLAALVQGGEVKNQLTIAGVQQTLLRVTVAEVNKTCTRQLGVNWAIGGSDWTRDFFLANNLGQLNPTVITSSGVPNVLLPNSAGGQITYAIGAVGNAATTNITFGFPRAELQMFMQALRENDLARVLAEPNLVAISGQTATFLAGGEVPIPVTQGGATAGSITIEYKEFGVRLAFTPTVLGGQVIRLHVMTEVSQATPSGAISGGLPVFSFTTRRVESTIECGNGQSFAIAGLLDDQVTSTASKIPALGDIPVLGTLFSSTNYKKQETELVVLVTPQLVEPLEPHQVGPPPGGLMTDPDDFELFALQKLEGPSLPAPEYEGVPRNKLPVNTRPGEATTGWPTSQLTLRGPWGLADFEENQ
ncbi:MAG TPA: type II and III secretion system protein family protein [Phycisphaerae bacterium]|nr:type II and III secretion system protein family protein [Phycisphaerae bacterium]